MPYATRLAHPANLTYRKYLRQVEKNKYKNNLHGSRMALVTTATGRSWRCTPRRCTGWPCTGSSRARSWR